MRQALLGGTFQRKEVEKVIPTLAEYAQEFLDTYARVHNKPSEVSSKEMQLRCHLLPALGAKRLDTIRLREVERLKADLTIEGLAPKSINNALAVLGKMLRHAAELEIIDKVPRVRLLKAPLPDFDFLTFEEADRLVAAARAHEQEWAPMVFLGLRTGLRYGELAELRWDDVDLVAGRIMVRRSYYKGHITTPKGGRAREMPLSAETVTELKRHRHLRGELVFCKPDGARLRDSTADDVIKRIARRAGLRRISWHVLRHTFASHLVMRGVPLKAVQELLGHTTINMTMRYSHLTPDVRRDAVSVLDSSREPDANRVGAPIQRHETIREF